MVRWVIDVERGKIIRCEEDGKVIPCPERRPKSMLCTPSYPIQYCDDDVRITIVSQSLTCSSPQPAKHA